MADSAKQFLVIDSDGKGHLPVRDSADGPLNHHLMGAAWAALHGGYRGNKYEGEGKAEAIAKLKALYTSEGMALPSETNSELGIMSDLGTPMGPIGPNRGPIQIGPSDSGNRRPQKSGNDELRTSQPGNSAFSIQHSAINRPALSRKRFASRPAPSGSSM